MAAAAVLVSEGTPDEHEITDVGRHVTISTGIENTGVRDIDQRTIIGLECTKCKNRNYSTTKNKTRTPDKLVLKKFCPACRTHTEHKESK